MSSPVTCFRLSFSQFDMQSQFQTVHAPDTENRVTKRAESVSRKREWWKSVEEKREKLNTQSVDL